MLSAQAPYRLPLSHSTTSLGLPQHQNQRQAQPKGRDGLLSGLKHSTTQRSISMPAPPSDELSWRRPQNQTTQLQQQQQYQQLQQQHQQQQQQQQQQQEQYAAIAQRQQLLQYEMLKLQAQAYQQAQAQLQNQYFAQAQAQAHAHAQAQFMNYGQQHAQPQRQTDPEPEMMVAPDGSIQQRRSSTPDLMNSQALASAASKGANTSAASSPTQVSPTTPEPQPHPAGEHMGYPFEHYDQAGSANANDLLASMYQQQQQQLFLQQQKLLFEQQQQQQQQQQHVPRMMAGRGRLQTANPAGQTQGAGQGPAAAQGAGGMPLSFPMRQPCGPPTHEVEELQELNFASRAHLQPRYGYA